MSCRRVSTLKACLCTRAPPITLDSTDGYSLPLEGGVSSRHHRLHPSAIWRSLVFSGYRSSTIHRCYMAAPASSGHGRLTRSTRGGPSSAIPIRRKGGETPVATSPQFSPRTCSLRSLSHCRISDQIRKRAAALIRAAAAGAPRASRGRNSSSSSSAPVCPWPLPASPPRSPGLLPFVGFLGSGSSSGSRGTSATSCPQRTTLHRPWCSRHGIVVGDDVHAIGWTQAR
mmetsp:Transcript_99668/g.287732  ORF Transcript_99668/g.287732 Transcript_99668/m.287732 type:complete len:228 (-) Transcript_99668:264-947(-)